ncbi:UNVERIFIED_CONTAM: hypothetical protein RMT77_019574 [Armadillidium vulgare]
MNFSKILIFLTCTYICIFLYSVTPILGICKLEMFNSTLCLPDQKSECEETSDCKKGFECCFDGCIKFCEEQNINDTDIIDTNDSDKCLKNPDELKICVPGEENECENSEDCSAGMACCSDGCVNKCQTLTDMVPEEPALPES